MCVCVCVYVCVCVFVCVCSLLPANWREFFMIIPYIDHACLQSISADVCIPVVNGFDYSAER